MVAAQRENEILGDRRWWEWKKFEVVVVNGTEQNGCARGLLANIAMCALFG